MTVPPLTAIISHISAGEDDVVEESAAESKATTTEESETTSKYAAGEEEDMEVIDDLEEGSGGSDISAEDDFSEGDEATGSATPSTSASSKSESGLYMYRLLARH